MWIALAVPAMAAADGRSEAGPPGPRATQDEVRLLVARVGPEVERMRSLRFRRAVPGLVAGQRQAREHMVRRFEKFEGGPRYRHEARAMTLLGILPGGVDILEQILGFLGEQAGGYYDPESGSLFLLEDVPRALAPLVVAHELTHALEDQHFGIDARLAEVADDADRAFARSAVHEGSATLLMLAYAARAVGDGSLTPSDLREVAAVEAERGKALEGFPAALLRPLLGAYLLGAGFLAQGDPSSLSAGAGAFPAERADRICGDDGPRSSEQILHPEKYWDPERRDDPSSLPPGGAGKLLGRGFRLRAHGVLGELVLGCLVDAPTPRSYSDLGSAAASWTNAAASGWDGDRWELWTRGPSAVVLLNTVWDTEQDAREFEQALSGRAGLVWQRRGSLVALLAGDAGEGAQGVLARMLEAVPSTEGASADAPRRLVPGGFAR